MEKEDKKMLGLFILYIVFVFIFGMCIGALIVNKTKKLPEDDNIISSEITYNNHSYIIFENNKTFNIIHSPECWCLNDLD